MEIASPFAYSIGVPWKEIVSISHHKNVLPADDLQ